MKLLIAVIFAFTAVNYSRAEEIIVPNVAARNFGIDRTVPCGSIINRKSITITNPAQPPLECIYRIRPSSLKVCQVRLEFDITLQPPTLPVDAANSPVTVPTCVRDEFRVGNFRFCGSSEKQNIYIPFNITRFDRQRTIELRFRVASRFSDATLSAALWTLRITQLDCPIGAPRSIPSFRSVQETGSNTDVNAISPFMERTFGSTSAFWIAPVGCLQYFPHPEGIVESFNYNAGRGPYLPNLHYAICFRRREADTRLTLTFESFGMNSVLATNPGYDANCLTPAPAAPGTGNTANVPTSEDFLLVPNAVAADGTRVIRLCGNTVNTRVVVATQPGPFMIEFHSDNLYNPRVFSEAGFRIKYKID